MSIEIKVPFLGHNVEEGTVGRWLKSEGQEVSANEIIVELEAEKAIMEIESPADGTLASILAPEGSQIKPNEVLGYIAEPGETFAKPEKIAPSQVETAHEDQPEEQLVELCHLVGRQGIQRCQASMGGLKHTFDPLTPQIGQPVGSLPYPLKKFQPSQCFQPLREGRLGCVRKHGVIALDRERCRIAAPRQGQGIPGIESGSRTQDSLSHLVLV